MGVVRIHMRKGFDTHRRNISARIFVSISHGDTAIEVGKFTLQGEGGQTVDEGKYLVVWKQADGQWKLHRDIFNSSMPVPEQAEQ